MYADWVEPATAEAETRLCAAGASHHGHGGFYAQPPLGYGCRRKMYRDACKNYIGVHISDDRD